MSNYISYADNEKSHRFKMNHCIIKSSSSSSFNKTTTATLRLGNVGVK